MKKSNPTIKPHNLFVIIILSLYICGWIAGSNYPVTRETRTPFHPFYCSGSLKSGTMSDKKYLIEPGQRFGRLTVIKEVYRTDYRGGKDRCAECICDCGNKIITRVTSLGKFTNSCGCYRKENSAAMLYIHGRYYDPVMRIFKLMKRRCYAKQDKQYDMWGGRGIRICDEWLNNPILFCDWAYLNGYKKDLTIERIDNNGNYSPNNCRFADRRDQANNTRNNRIIEYKGEKLAMAAFCRKYNLKYDKFRQRIYSKHFKSIEIAMQNCAPYVPMNGTDKKEDSLYQKL